MPRFIVSETQACFVTWTREVEAPNAEAAQKFVKDSFEGEDCKLISENPNYNGDPEIGDNLDDYDGEWSVEQLDTEDRV